MGAAQINVDLKYTRTNYFFEVCFPYTVVDVWCYAVEYRLFSDQYRLYVCIEF